MVRYLIAFHLQRHATFPLASLLGWEITDKASILVLPAGVLQLLAFYFLRWWFVAFALVALRMVEQAKAFQYTIHYLSGTSPARSA